MKTLLVSLPANGPAALRQVPDSALLTGARPLFLPDWADKTNLTVMPAARICRLGLAIARQFADRYFDAVTLAALNLPVNPSEQGPRPLTDADLIADNTLVVGAWTPTPAPGVWSCTGTDGQTYSWDIGDAFCRAIAAVSSRSTLKTGDIIVLQDYCCRTTAALDTRPAWTLNGSDTLHFKIK